MRGVLPRNARNAQKVRVRGVLPRNARNAQKVRVRGVLPRNARNAQKVRVRGVIPRNARNVRGCSSLCCTNQAEMYCPQNTQNTQKFSSARKFCEFCGSTFQQEASVCSVNSVGRCNGCSVGAAETAAPPGWVRVAALNNPPTDGTDAHRCLGCVVLSHGTRRIHRSSPLQENSVNSVGVHFSKRLLCVL